MQPVPSGGKQACAKTTRVELLVLVSFNTDWLGKKVTCDQALFYFGKAIPAEKRNENK